MFLRSIPYKWLVAVVFVTGIFMDVLDTTIVNVALPALGRHFRASDTTLAWVVTAYLPSLAVWIPASGWLGDRFGTKRVFLVALALFTVGSALCGLAGSIGVLIACRVLQGVGGGMLTPVGTAMLFRAFPPHERAQASAVMMVPIGVAPTLGPILGGLLVDEASWRWIFYANLPVGVLGFLFALACLREHREEHVGRFDPWGFLLAGTGLPLVLYALSQAPGAGWGAPRVVGPGLAGAALLTLLVVVELRVREPMLGLRLLGDRMFRLGNAVTFAVSAGLLGVLFLLPLYLQQLRGLSALRSGLTTFPQALGVVAVARLASTLYPRLGPRRLLIGAMAVMALSTVPFLWVGLTTSLWWIRAVMLARGVALGLASVPLQAASYATVRPRDMGRASALYSANRQVAASFGVAVLATVLVERTKTAAASMGPTSAVGLRQAALRGYHDAFLAAVLIAVIGVAAACLIRDEDAAASLAVARLKTEAEAGVAPALPAAATD